MKMIDDDPYYMTKKGELENEIALKKEEISDMEDNIDRMKNDLDGLHCELADLQDNLNGYTPDPDMDRDEEILHPHIRLADVSDDHNNHD